MKRTKGREKRLNKEKSIIEDRAKLAMVCHSIEMHMYDVITLGAEQCVMWDNDFCLCAS